MTLREECEKAASEFAECGDDWRTAAKNGTPCKGCSSQVSAFADAMERVAITHAATEIEACAKVAEYFYGSEEEKRHSQQLATALRQLAMGIRNMPIRATAEKGEP